MKTKLLLLFAFLSMQYTFGQKQNAYVDALKKHQIDSIVQLKNNVKNSGFYIEKDSILKTYDYVFENYGLNSDSINKSKNFDLKNLKSLEGIDKIKLTIAETKSLNEVRSTIVPKVASAASFSNIESELVNALATFIAGRFKEESIHFAINSYFKKIVDPKTDSEKTEAKMVESFFPNLTKQIKALYNEGNSSYYSADLVYLSQVAKSDLNNTPNSLVNNFSTLFPNTPVSLNDLLLITSSIYKNSTASVPLNEIITNLDTLAYKDPDFKSAASLLASISEGLLNVSNKSELWVNPITNLDPSLIETDKVIKDTYSFLYIELKRIKPVKTYIEKDGDDLAKVANNIFTLLNVVNELNDIYNKIKTKEFKLKTTEDKITYIKSINTIVTNFLTQLNTMGVLSVDIAYLAKSDSYLTIIQYFLNKDYITGYTQLSIEFNDVTLSKGKYSRILSFTSQLAVVKNSEEMEKMLQGFAAPIGSSSIKRVSTFSISLNSYVGLNFGYEKILSITNDKPNGTYFGVTAPIGFAFSALRSKTGSWSLILSAIDLGSLVNTRINNDTTTYSNLKFEHFFTPGVGIAYNFKGTPLTIGAFASYISNIKDISYADGVATITETNKDVFRFNFSVMVDIPLLNIYKKE